ncbi:hypothetical protein PV387_14645 [Streptomyces sp. ME02-6987-2C]|uniref:hypothetical protein n=1 Tax=unclassified Streptomyces TaxID=2593676 RepID=UPI0029A9C227|nr:MULTISPECIES: hypothetical protein [unclassified Streptomyces]MDX3345855.1 hypothetical protein [Streptomyces sp. ME02-6979A]MDX3367258.1 hypothetical protein [Streptomyces sp. ME02-6987-2C]MDX3421621.1 hypothetical protein [Streptomyces sp. ME02-6985-2c]
MRSAWEQRPAYDRSDPNLTGPLVVNFDLGQLKVGENWISVGRKDGLNLCHRDIAPGDGWSRARYAPECAWPRGAELCVLVEWYPDLEAGSDWNARLEAVTAGLRSLGYVVERAGRPIDPAKDLGAHLLVYRMEPGKTPPSRPADAWTHAPAPKTYTWPERDPLDHVRWLLSQTKARGNGARVTVWTLASALWPPEADLCGHVRWWPAEGSGEAVHRDLREVVSVMRDEGYRVRQQERSLPNAVREVDLLVYRVADTGATD